MSVEYEKHNDRKFAHESSFGSNDLETPSDDSTVLMYRNSLLAAVGYLDLTNALDFPANVWNNVPIPLYAQVLMGIGGSISALFTAFAFWDIVRASHNVKVLREERRNLKARITQKQDGVLIHEERAWLHINFRELGWEIIDRILMDAFMAVAGLLVGAGCLMAIRGDIPVVYSTSNILSGYLGNSFVAAYALFSTTWSVYMWRMADKNKMAVNAQSEHIDQDIQVMLRKHALRHKLYAFLNGLSLLVAGVGSEISSTMWEGYVVLIPCVVGSIFCNYYWRNCLGYNRRSFRDRSSPDCIDLTRLRLLRATRLHLSGNKQEEAKVAIHMLALNSEATLHNCLYDVSSRSEFCAQLKQRDVSLEAPFAATTGDEQRAQKVSDAYMYCISTIDAKRFRDEERFWLELYGYYLREMHD